MRVKKAESKQLPSVELVKQFQFRFYTQDEEDAAMAATTRRRVEKQFKLKSVTEVSIIYLCTQAGRRRNVAEEKCKMKLCIRKFL